MRLPAAFRWTITDGHTILSTIDGAVDTQCLYGAVTVVAGYKYAATHGGRSMFGRGYVEYTDRRCRDR